jgi:hypothetical protein
VRSVVTGGYSQSGQYKPARRIRESRPSTLARYAEKVATGLGWQPEPGEFHLLFVEPDDPTFIRWNNATNDQYVARWPAGTEIARRGTCATSQGPCEAAACSSI